MTIPNEPESEGIPDVADEDSYAYDDYDRARFADSPPILPADEALAVDDYGMTGYEISHHEPLAARLMREERDVSPDDPETAPEAGIAEEAMTDEAQAQAARDADTFGFGQDDVDLDEPPVGYVGRLLSPDEGGSFEDDEPQSTGYDSGEGEGQAPEEAAMHEVPQEDVRYE